MGRRADGNATNRTEALKLQSGGGGSRAQRRNKARARLQDQQQKDYEEKKRLWEEQGWEQEGEKETASEVSQPMNLTERAEKRPAGETPDDGPPKKKTKKEKKRERKEEAERQQRQQQQDGPAAATALPGARESVKEAVDEGRRIFVGHLPQSTSEAELRAFFGGACVDEVDMSRRPDTGRFKGCAFLTFATASAASAALALDSKAWHDAKPIRVQRANGVRTEGAAEAPDRKSSNGVKSEATEPSLSVFVGNLPAQTTEKGVRDVLRKCGKIQKVTLLPLRESLPEQRCGFVDFQSLEASAEAIKLSGSTLLGRMLTIAYSVKAKPPSSGGRRSQEAKKRRKERREEQRNAKESTHGSTAYAGPLALSSS
jgi:RNA recognition motif-containing protein